jgi:hypothetical protein
MPLAPFFDAIVTLSVYFQYMFIAVALKSIFPGVAKS